MNLEKMKVTDEEDFDGSSLENPKERIPDRNAQRLLPSIKEKGEI
ncbi:hypothetical protein [Dyadobacter sp. OTU695]